MCAEKRGLRYFFISAKHIKREKMTESHNIARRQGI